MKEALLYEQLDDQRVRCVLCAHRCIIAPGRKGVCLVRENRDGTLYTLVYGIPLSQAVDPVEKKPLFHFYPGSTAFSIATAGCNFRCDFCQNADISQMPRDRGQILGRQATPEEVVRAARRSGSQSIAYTYTEPTIFFEYSYDIARLAHEVGIASVYVTNGYMTPEMLELFQGVGNGHEPWLDAANVDLKAFRDETYKKVCGARLQPVLDSLIKMKELGIWVEVTTLVVPDMNDSDGELAEIARFISTELGAETPWHVSRFHPDYKMNDRGPTSVTALRRAYELGRDAGLRYVYVGNLPGAHLEDTYCPNCGKSVIGRWGFQVTQKDLQAGKCSSCGTEIDGVGM
ncbi:MAG TPA: AmmeMemoRadiSam system radical SAM enzyme [Anaerolineae bacterium]|nr:AmmeMemoRadiSam system radical SAM enzyme [Anaerolineae bacterium]